MRVVLASITPVDKLAEGPACAVPAHPTLTALFTDARPATVHHESTVSELIDRGTVAERNARSLRSPTVSVSCTLHCKIPNKDTVHARKRNMSSRPAQHRTVPFEEVRRD